MFALVGFASKRKKILCKNPLIWSIHYPFNPNPYLHTVRENIFLCRPYYALHSLSGFLFYWTKVQSLSLNLLIHYIHTISYFFQMIVLYKYGLLAFVSWFSVKSGFYNPQESPTMEGKCSCYNSKIDISFHSPRAPTDLPEKFSIF